MINEIVVRYTKMTNIYASLYNAKHNVDYNKMIKQSIDEEIFATSVNTAVETYKMPI